MLSPHITPAGRSRLPLSREQFPEHFVITGVNGGDDRLPEAHTCFFTLDLPNYSSAEETYQKLVYASNLTVGIDVNMP